MLFQIRRTGHYDDNHCLWDDSEYEVVSPHPRAIAMEYIYTDRRSVSMAELKPDVLNNFMAYGFNHRDTETGSARDCKAVGHFIEFATIEELTAFCQESGSIILQEFNDCNSLAQFQIEIYDDYRE